MARIPFQFSVSDPALRASLPNVPLSSEGPPAAGKRVVAGASATSAPPRTEIQKTASNITQKQAAGFLEGISNGHTPRGGTEGA